MLQRLSRAVQIRLVRAFPGKLRRISLAAPIASITFDDFARSAWTAGGEIVEAAGGRATYYVSGSLCRKTVNGLEYYSEADLANIRARGHEIACHSFDHLAFPRVSNRCIGLDLERNAAFIREAASQDSISSFAYPFGAASIRTKLKLGDRFPACRGIEPGINAGLADFSQLRAVCLQPHFLRDYPVAGLIEAIRRRKGWLIFIGHDVSPNPTPYGCTPGVLKEALTALQDAGIGIVTVREALTQLGHITKN